MTTNQRRRRRRERSREQEFGAGSECWLQRLRGKDPQDPVFKML